VEPPDERIYDELIPLVQAHAKGESIYAAPDCPEVYFLSGLPSPMRHYFEYAEDPVGLSERTLGRIERLEVNVVAINESPRFSAPMPADLLSELEKRFPYFRNLGKFQVRWRK
jgi:hypothetical protein